MPQCIALARCAEKLPLARLSGWRMQQSSVTLTHGQRVRYATKPRFGAVRKVNTDGDLSSSLLSRRRHKNSKRDPSRLITAALRNAGITIAIPPTFRHRRESKRRKLKTEQQRTIRRIAVTPKRDDHPTFQKILYRYIQRNQGSVADSNEAPETSSLAKARLLGKHIVFLESHGYTTHDVAHWASLLTSRDVEESARMLVEQQVVSQLSLKFYKRIPSTVLTYLLRRPLTPTALRHFITHSWQQLYTKKEAQLDKTTPSSWSTRSSDKIVKPPAMDESTIAIMIVRLLRHAGKVWPASVPAIIEMLCFNINLNLKIQSIEDLDRTAQNKKTRRTEELCNRVLSILALPSPINPFHSMQFYERAQFDLLRCMAEHDPPLAVTRRGYRGIASVQLRQKKNEQERDWTSLKAKSWPPWKEDRTGFDADKDAEYGASRALKVLWKMRNAGYGGLLWERVAEIYTGWDIDQSPTIQTRTVLLNRSPMARVKSFDSNHRMIWAARLQTTRTVQEAWACFLEYKDKVGEGHEEVYYAMLEKIASGERQSKRRLKEGGSSEDRDALLPGDMKDTIPAPVSPKEATYVPTEPPSLDTLAQEMRDRDILISERCVCLLLENTRSMKHGLKYIQWVTSEYPEVGYLTSVEATADELRRIPKRIFAAYIKLLCRSRSSQSYAPRRSSHGSLVQYTWLQALPNVVVAIRLLQTLLPTYLPPWRTVLDVVVDRFKLLNANGRIEQPTPADVIEKYFLAQRLQREMERAGLPPDLETFRQVAHSLEHGVRSAQRTLQHGSNRIASQTQTQEPAKAANRIFDQSTYISRLFHRVVGNLLSSGPGFVRLDNNDPLARIPVILAFPYPAALHQFARVLGFLHSWKRMLELVELMVRHRKDIISATAMPRNGRVLLKRTIVAIRVFAEGCWVTYGRNDFGESEAILNTKDKRDDSELNTSAPKEMVDAMRSAIESIEEFGGWPSDDDVIEYCIAGDFTEQKLQEQC